jgi:hypothetical protein
MPGEVVAAQDHVKRSRRSCARHGDDDKGRHAIGNKLPVVPASGHVAAGIARVADVLGAKLNRAGAIQLLHVYEMLYELEHDPDRHPYRSFPGQCTQVQLGGSCLVFQGRWSIRDPPDLDRPGRQLHQHGRRDRASSRMCEGSTLSVQKRMRGPAEEKPVSKSAT